MTLHPPSAGIIVALERKRKSVIRSVPVASKETNPAGIKDSTSALQPQAAFS
jgi:hypothetical protein